MAQSAGQKLQELYFESTGGLNLTDSPFVVSPKQATGGYNYEYVKTGGIQKSLSPFRLNSVANAQEKTLGLFLRNTKNSVKSIIRAAGRKIQLTDLMGTFLDLAEDSAAAGSDFLAADSSQPVVSAMNTTPTLDVLWLAGGGMSGIYGVPSDAQVTANGVAAPTGSITATESGGGGDFDTTGTYFYAVAYRKRSTQSLSNVALDASVELTSTSNKVVISLSGLTNLDATKYDKIYLYRSAVGGVAAFTTGALIAQLDSTATSYTDTGTAITTAENIARPGNLILDNSPLPSGSYKTLAIFKNRLVTASGSTVYLSDVNKPESWPLANTINVPTGGEITGLAIISFTTPSATTTDEFLAVFKETELHIITGDGLDTWSRKFVDSTGCLGQPLIVNANGYLYFIDNRGVYLWDGAGKPVYISRPIEELFGVNGTLDRSKLRMGFGVFFSRQNEVVWALTNTDQPEEQRYLLKLDLRLTLPSVGNTLGQRILDGVFLQGKTASPMYAGASFVFPTSSNQEDVFVTGDGAGYVYRQFYSSEGSGADDYDFSYETSYLDQGRPGIAKRYEKVIAWVENVGNWNLTLDYWTDYRNGDDEKHSLPVTINSASDGKTALWDVAKWDQALWDNYKSKPKALVFNLSSQPFGNAEGDVLRLRFRNSGSNQPVIIYGFSVLYSEIGLRK